MSSSDLKGLSKYFNSQTIQGRANVAKITIGGLVVGYIIWKYKKTIS